MDAVGLRRFRQKYLDGGVIPSLLDLSIQTAIRNVDGLSDVGWTDLDLLDRILPYCRVHQLELVEDSTECRDLTPITDKLWKKFYMHEFGEESMNDAITTMEDMDVIYKWRDLYNAKLKLREEAKKESAKRLKQRYMELNEKKLNRQVQLTSKIPPSGKKRYWAAASSFKSPNASSTKGNLMKKSRLEFLNCNEVRNHTAIINRKKFSSQRLRAPQNSDNSRMGGSVGGSLASAPCNGNLNGRWAPQNSTNSRTGGSVTSVASSSASAAWKGKPNGRW